MFCPKCGSKIDDWQNYCPKCGYKLSDNSIQTETGTQTNSANLYPSINAMFYIMLVLIIIVVVSIILISIATSLGTDELGFVIPFIFLIFSFGLEITWIVYCFIIYSKIKKTNGQLNKSFYSKSYLVPAIVYLCLIVPEIIGYDIMNSQPTNSLGPVLVFLCSILSLVIFIYTFVITCKAKIALNKK